LFKSQNVWKKSTRPSIAWNPIFFSFLVHFEQSEKLQTPIFSYVLSILNNLKSYEWTN
jgi:hypothetical protein